MRLLWRRYGDVLRARAEERPQHVDECVAETVVDECVLKTPMVRTLVRVVQTNHDRVHARRSHAD